MAMPISRRASAPRPATSSPMSCPRSAPGWTSSPAASRCAARSSPNTSEPGDPCDEHPSAKPLRPDRPGGPRHRRLARPGPADRRSPGRGGRQDHADLAQGGRPGRCCRRAAGQGHRRALERRRCGQARGCAARGGRDHGAPGPHRHPRQQRRRHLGRPGRGASARGLGQGHEPQHPQPLPVRAGRGQGQHDPAPCGPHHQCGLHRRPVGQPGCDEDHCLQHQQGRGGELHAGPGRRVGRVWHHRQCAGAGLLPEQDDPGPAGHAGG
mmetsp:Transcript_21087/g.81839  ORF Transcript_21087/g.81839 Transcript_21087/m.81839 type:complete len:267 (-) Transcript_21087:2837-3637(-)